MRFLCGEIIYIVYMVISISAKAPAAPKDAKPNEAKPSLSGAKQCNAKGSSVRECTQKGPAPKEGHETNACGRESGKCGTGKSASAGAGAGAGSGKAPEMKLEKIPLDKLKDVVEHQKRSFYCNDPLHIALGTCQDEDALKTEMERTKKTIEEGMSVMALADGKVVAAHLNGLMCPGTNEKDMAALADPKKPLEKFQYVQATANAKVNLFEKYGVQAIYDMKMASVDENFQCPNVAFEAIKLDEKIAREAGFKLIKAEASGIYAADLLEKLGFESVSETRYDSVLDKDCKVLINVKEPNSSYKIMVKKL